MSPTPPLWLLDIDGVINAIRPASSSRPPHWNDWFDGPVFAPFAGRSWRILAARPVVDFINKVHDAGLAEIRWHTTWLQDAKQVADAVGLYNFPVHAEDLERPPDRRTWWKLAGTWRALAEDKTRPVLWTDDDISVETTRDQRNRLLATGRVSIIEPLSHLGLTRAHLDQIETWLRSKEQ